MKDKLKTNVHSEQVAPHDAKRMLPAVFVNRFFEEKKVPSDLKFDKKLGDVIMLDGRYQLITGFGIYDNQMWTEKIYEDGCHLGAGNYEDVKDAIIINDISINKYVIDAYKKELSENYYKFQTEYYTEKQLNDHMSQFLNGL